MSSDANKNWNYCDTGTAAERIGLENRFPQTSKHDRRQEQPTDPDRTHHIDDGGGDIERSMGARIVNSTDRKVCRTNGVSPDVGVSRISS